jgi:DNA-binding GntR family transcriptional regulator
VNVNHDSPEPAHRQLAEVLRERISAGEWRDGPLPSPGQLRQEYDVDRITAVRAIELLLDEQLVYRVPKRGVYVTPQD